MAPDRLTDNPDRGKTVTRPLTIDDFTPHIGKLVHFTGTPFAFPIDRVIGDGGPPPPGLPRAPFIVIFRGPKTPIMAEGFL